MVLGTFSTCSKPSFTVRSSWAAIIPLDQVVGLLHTKDIPRMGRNPRQNWGLIIGVVIRVSIKWQNLSWNRGWFFGEVQRQDRKGVLRGWCGGFSCSLYNAATSTATILMAIAWWVLIPSGNDDYSLLWKKSPGLYRFTYSCLIAKSSN